MGLKKKDLIGYALIAFVVIGMAVMIEGQPGGSLYPLVGWMIPVVQATPRPVPPPPAPEAAAEPTPEPYQLELLGWNWDVDHGYVTVEGQVRNAGETSVDFVQVEATFKDANGGFVGSEDAYLKKKELAPGETSTFKIMGQADDRMKKASLEFIRRGKHVPARDGKP